MAVKIIAALVSGFIIAWILAVFVFFSPLRLPKNPFRKRWEYYYECQEAMNPTPTVPDWTKSQFIFKTSAMEAARERAFELQGIYPRSYWNLFRVRVRRIEGS